MTNRILFILLIAGSAFHSYAQVAGVDWLTTMTTIDGFVNQSNGGLTGDMLVSPGSNSLIVLGSNQFIGGSALYFTEDDSLSMGMFLASYRLTTGELQWLKKFAEGGSVRPQALEVDDEGNLYVLGDYRYMRYGIDSLVSGTGRDMFVAKHDSSGNVLWIRDMGSSTFSIFQYDDTSIDLKVVGDQLYVHVETHGNFMYDGDSTAVSEYGGEYSVLLRLNSMDGSLLNHAVIDNFNRSGIVVGSAGGVFSYCQNSVIAVNGTLIEQIPGNGGQLLKFNKHLELERIVNMNLKPWFSDALSLHDDHVIIGGRIDSDFDSVLVDGIGVLGFDTLEPRWLILCFDKDGNFVWASDEKTLSGFSNYVSVRSTGSEIFAMSHSGKTAIYHSNGNHLLTQTLTTGNTSYRNAVIDTAGGAVYLYSNYRGDASVLDVNLSSTGGTEDAFLARLKYSRPNSVSSISQPAGLHVYPNPTNSVVSITLAKPNPQHQPSVSLYDVHGRLLQVPTTISAAQVQLDMTNLPSGMYFGRLLVGDRSASSGQGFKVVRE